MRASRTIARHFLLDTASAVSLLALFAVLSLAQTAEIAPGDNLVVEGIPKIPASLAEAVGRYTEFRSATVESWHPARREMLISTRFGETNQIHRVKFPGGARTQLTFFSDRVAGAAFPRHKADFFVFNKDIAGGEWFQIYRYDLADGAVTLLTDGKSRNLSGPWSNSGDRLVYASNRRSRADMDLYVIQPADPQSDRLLAKLEGGGWIPLDWSPDDSRILVSEIISANESYLWLFDSSSGQKTPLTPKGDAEKVWYGAAKFSKNSSGFYVTTDRDSEFQRLAYVDLATKRHTYLTDHIKWDADEFALSPDGKVIAFVTNEDGSDVFRLLDTATNKERRAPKLPVGQVYGFEWHENSAELAFNVISARSTTDVYSLNISTGKLDRWTESESGGLNTAGFSEPELVRWKSFDGRTISGFLYKPLAKFTGPRPVMVSIHGGPESQFRSGFLGRINYFLNELGVAVIYPNIRGSSGYGKTFLKLDNGVLREGAYKDIGALLDWIGTRADLDAKRVMVTGGSYGGHMTLAVATLYSDRIAAAVDSVGPSNLVTFLENTESYRRDLRRAEYGDERDPNIREFLERTAPLNNSGKIRKPLFVIQGKNDPRVPLSESEQIIAAVRKNNVPVWYLMAKDEGHGFAKKKNQDFQFYSTVLFMKEFLLK